MHSRLMHQARAKKRYRYYWHTLWPEVLSSLSSGLNICFVIFSKKHSRLMGYTNKSISDFGTKIWKTACKWVSSFFRMVNKLAHLTFAVWKNLIKLLLRFTSVQTSIKKLGCIIPAPLWQTRISGWNNFFKKNQKMCKGLNLENWESLFLLFRLPVCCERQRKKEIKKKILSKDQICYE